MTAIAFQSESLDVPTLTIKSGKNGECHPELMFKGSDIIPLISVDLHIHKDEFVTATIELPVKPDVEINTLLEKVTVAKQKG